jgi:hypothetical protein
VIALLLVRHCGSTRLAVAKVKAKADGGGWAAWGRAHSVRNWLPIVVSVGGTFQDGRVVRSRRCRSCSAFPVRFE